MITHYQELITLLPILIIGLSILVIMLIIAWQRNHCIIAMVTVTSLIFSFLSLFFVLKQGSIGIPLLMYIDNFSVLYSGQILISSIATTILTYNWLVEYNGNCEEFYLLLLIATMGGIILTSANHMATLFIGIELISLPLFGMIAYTFHQKYPLEASIKYTLLSAVASSFLLFGIGLLYTQTGLLSYYKIAQMFNDTHTTCIHPLFVMGLGMIIVGLGFKLSLVPFHLWTPDIYQGAPAPVSAFLSTANKIAIFAVITRIFLYIPIVHTHQIKLLFSIIAFSSILFGNLMALNQNNIKRILGYSSIAHVGYLLIELVPVVKVGLAIEAISIYLLGYLFANLGVFGIISLMSNPNKSEDTSELFLYRGLFWRQPLLASTLTLMMLSLAGIPMTLGFIGKFYVIIFSISHHLVWLTATVVVGSAIGLFYYLRVIIILYLTPPKSTHYFITPNWIKNPVGFIVLVSSLIVLLGGFYPQPLIILIQSTKLV